MEVSDNFFDAYEQRVKQCLGFDPAHKSEVINRFGAHKEKRPIDGKPLVKNLYEVIDFKRGDGGNWRWRHGAPDQITTRSKEVRLERKLVRVGRDAGQQWSWQLSTTSGARSDSEKESAKGANKRRAIDLIRDYENGRFAFIELKTGSDNPVYAAFELLGYALAYLREQRNPTGAPEGELFKARQIDLIVLGPMSWYRYRRPLQEGFHEMLGTALSDGLNALSAGKPEFRFVFREFASDPMETDRAAKEIIADFDADKSD